LQHFFPSLQHSLAGVFVQQSPSQAHSLQAQLPEVQQAQSASQQAQQLTLALTGVPLAQQFALAAVAQQPWLLHPSQLQWQSAHVHAPVTQQ
jgi:hypothetical protein